MKTKPLSIHINKNAMEAKFINERGKKRKACNQLNMTMC